MILTLDIGQMLLSTIFFGPTMIILSYYLGKHNNRFEAKAYQTKIARLQNQMDELKNENLTLREDLKEDLP